MKRIAISLLSLLLLVRCSESETDYAPADRLIGSWKNIAEENAIDFDGENNYSIQFGPDTAFSYRYQVSRSEDNKLYIYDLPVTYECSYRFLEDNVLELTRLNPPQSSDIDHTVSIYRRLPGK